MMLVYLSPVPWTSFAQRPHFMARFFLKNGYNEVIWIDPYPARLPIWQDLKRSRSLHNQGTTTEPGLVVIRPRFLPIDPLPGGYWLNTHFAHRGFLKDTRKLLSQEPCVLGIGKPSCLAVQLIASSHWSASFYDAMDDFPQFHDGLSKKSVQRNETFLAGAVDKIFCSSNSLIEKFKSYRIKLTLLKNAFDESIIKILPQKRSSITPVIGYIGSLGKWFDWDLVCRLADLSPSYEFRLIGPQIASVPKKLPLNIKILPACRHDEVMLHLYNFNVGLIPFKKNKLTDSIDPVKFYEYRAVGLPIITTNFGQMDYRKGNNGIFFVNSNTEATIVDDALECVLSEHEIEAWRAENTWTKRFEELKKLKNFSADI